MKRKFVHFIRFAFLLLSSSICAQEYTSIEMEQIGKQLKNRSTLPKADATFDIKNSALTAYVRYDAKSRIKHLGIALFSDKEKKTIGRPLCEFYERFLLTVLLMESDAEANRFLTQKQVNISISGLTLNKASFTRSALEQSLLMVLKEKPRFMAVKNDFNWTMMWEGSHYTLSVIFPADVQLIMGMDKKEMGLFFKQELEAFSAEVVEPEPLIFNQESVKELRKDFYVLPGESFFIKAMNANVYITHDSETGYATVFNQRYPEESISNLFVAHNSQWVKGLEINIRQQIYDSTYVYKKPLEELIAFLQEDYDTFVGIEHCSQKKLDFTVIFRSKNYTFHHMLFVETTLGHVFNGEGTINSTLYTYIPNHNIKDLYHNQWNEQ